MLQSPFTATLKLENRQADDQLDHQLRIARRSDSRS